MKVPRKTRLLAGAAATFTATLAITSAALASTSPHPASSAIPQCKTSQLSVWVAITRGEGSNIVKYPLEFTNFSNRACYLDGYPEVFAIGGSGHQMGAAAGRDSSVTAAVVNLAPGATVHTELEYNTGPVFGHCNAQEAYQLQVRPPGRDQSTYASYDFASCTTPKPVYLKVQALQSGVGTNPAGH
jgi:hypothetical protein